MYVFISTYMQRGSPINGLLLPPVTSDSTTRGYLACDVIIVDAIYFVGKTCLRIYEELKFFVLKKKYDMRF